MSYKNSSQFGSRLSTDGSTTHSRKSPAKTASAKIKSNADIFEEHGNPWFGEPPLKTPRLSPDGKLRMSRRAHLYTLMNKEVQTIPLGEQATDLSFSTEHQTPLDIRLKKENNRLVPSISSLSSRSQSVSSRSPLLQARANLNTKRAQHLIKVK